MLKLQNHLITASLAQLNSAITKGTKHYYPSVTWLTPVRKFFQTFIALLEPTMQAAIAGLRNTNYKKSKILAILGILCFNIFAQTRAAEVRAIDEATLKNQLVISDQEKRSTFLREFAEISEIFEDNMRDSADALEALIKSYSGRSDYQKQQFGWYSDFDKHGNSLTAAISTFSNYRIAQLAYEYLASYSDKARLSQPTDSLFVLAREAIIIYYGEVTEIMRLLQAYFTNFLHPNFHEYHQHLTFIFTCFTDSDDPKKTADGFLRQIFSGLEYKAENIRVNLQAATLFLDQVKKFLGMVTPKETSGVATFLPLSQSISNMTASLALLRFLCQQFPSSTCPDLLTFWSMKISPDSRMPNDLLRSSKIASFSHEISRIRMSAERDILNASEPKTRHGLSPLSIFFKRLRLVKSVKITHESPLAAIKADSSWTSGSLMSLQKKKVNASKGALTEETPTNRNKGRNKKKQLSPCSVKFSKPPKHEEMPQAVEISTPENFLQSASDAEVATQPVEESFLTNDPSTVAETRESHINWEALPGFQTSQTGIISNSADESQSDEAESQVTPEGNEAELKEIYEEIRGYEQRRQERILEEKIARDQRAITPTLPEQRAEETQIVVPWESLDRSVQKTFCKVVGWLRGQVMFESIHELLQALGAVYKGNFTGSVCIYKMPSLHNPPKRIDHSHFRPLSKPQLGTIKSIIAKYFMTPFPTREQCLEVQ